MLLTGVNTNARFITDLETPKKHMEKSNEEIENEAKSILTRKEYLSLLAALALNWKSAKPQTNLYYDTEDWKLILGNTTLRVRQKKLGWELTLKRAAKDAKGVLEKNHRPFTVEQLEQLNADGTLPEGNVKEALGHIKVYLQGQLITDRIEIPYKGCKLALDINHYLGKVDYEVGMEREDPTADEKKVLLELLETVSIPYRAAVPKSKRFFSEKKFQATGDYHLS